MQAVILLYRENMGHPTEVTGLDEIDRRILRTISREGRISNADLGAKVGLSSSPCWTRVRRLEKAGVIRGYNAEIDLAKLGVPEVAIVEVTLDRHDDAIVEDFGRAVAQIPEILEVYLMTGEYDYLIKVAVSDTRDFEGFLRNRLYKIPGIRHSRTAFTLNCLKRSHSYVPDA